MEINKDQPNENKQTLFIQSSLWQESLASTTCIWQTQRQVGEWEGFLVKRRDGFRYALIGGS